MKAQILSPTRKNLERVAEALLREAVVGMPTETVYGLAGNARSAVALAKIFATKERPTFDPLIIHVSPRMQGIEVRNLEALAALKIIDLSKVSASQKVVLEQLIQTFWPGPLTLLLPKHEQIPDLATSGLPTVGVRMPAHPLAQALIECTGFPLAAPSANRFGRISPTTAQAVAHELGDRIEFILEGGPCGIGVESTIVGLQPGSDEVQILRPGGLAPEEIEKALGKPVHWKSSSSSPAALEAPGMLESHYAPLQPLMLLPKPVLELNHDDLHGIRQRLREISPDAPLAALYLSGDPQVLNQKLGQLLNRIVLGRSLSTQGDLNEAAQHLFQSMREVEALQTPVILAETCTIQTGLGFAIADRLKRASAPRTAHNS